MNLSFENPCPGRANGLSAYYFTQAVQMLLASHCMLGDPEDYPNDFGKSLKNNEEFDFIIIGGGSSGSVIANRLSEIAEWKILLIEAGGNPTFESDIPGFSLSLPGRDLDWKFEINKSENYCLGMEEEACRIFQGKVLGGTSTINKMHYVRGNPQDYDEWESLGNKGWSYKEVLPYFKKSEKLHEDFKILEHTNYHEKFNELKKAAGSSIKKLYELSKIVPGKYHSKSGIFSVNHFAFDSTLAEVKKRLCSAAEELETPHVADINGENQIGFVPAMGIIHEGNRGNTAKAFLSPVKNRQNLFVVKNAIVEVLKIKGKRVKGVKFVIDKESKTMLAKKEVILSAGAINTPRLLMLSGIGPSFRLKNAGVEIVKDIPGVGENLQMHISFFGLPVKLSKDKFNVISHLQKIDAMYNFISRGSGFFGNIGLNDILGFVNTKKNSNAPDIQLLFYLNRITDYYTFNELLISLKFKNEIRDQLTKAYATYHLLMISPTLLRPKSKGRVELIGPHFTQPPKIISNFFEHPEDLDVLIRGIRFGLKLIQTKAFKEFEAEFFKLEINMCQKFEYNSDKFWKCLIRHMSTSMHDAAGTCKMGPKEDPFAVVDDRLKIHGLDGIRVADSSVMPFIVRGSTSVASVMIGEKVSDLIKEDWKKIKHLEL